MKTRYCVEHFQTREQIGRICKHRQSAEKILQRLCDQRGVAMLEFYQVVKVRMVAPGGTA